MRKSYTADFKTRVALEAVKEHNTIAEIASKYELHPNQVINWKKKFLENVPTIFEDKRRKKAREEKAHTEEHLYKTIGQLQVENEFLRKKYKQIYGKDPD